MCKRGRNLFRSKVVDDDDPHKTEKKGNYFFTEIFSHPNERERKKPNYEMVFSTAQNDDFKIPLSPPFS